MSVGFDGVTFDRAKDGRRLGRQLERVRAVMADGRWRTLRALSDAVDAPEASTSARLRDLRKEKHGGLWVQRRRKAGTKGAWEYRVACGQGELFE